MDISNELEAHKRIPIFILVNFFSVLKLFLFLIAFANGSKTIDRLFMAVDWLIMHELLLMFEEVNFN